MKTLHTQGKWEMIEEGQGFTIVQDSTHIVTVDEGFNPRAENEANAKLMVASPKLLEALKLAQKFMIENAPIPVTKEELNDNAIEGGVWDKINKAIEAAE